MAVAVMNLKSCLRHHQLLPHMNMMATWMFKVEDQLQHIETEV